MKSFIPLAISIAVFHCACAQNSSTLIGSRANGLGYASSCLTDQWAVFNNIGGLAKTDHVLAGFSYDARPGFKSFNRMSAVAAIPFKLGVGGFGMFKFGDDLYNEQVVTAGYSNHFGLASLGIKVNYVQYNARGFGRKGVVSISFGGIAEITPDLSAGAHIVNLNQPEVAEQEKLPTILNAGLQYKISAKVFVAAEIEKDLDYPICWKAGLEYEVHRKLVFRTGANLNPDAGFIGLGFRPSKFNMDYAYTYNPDTGARHQASVGYRFNSKSK